MLLVSALIRRAHSPRTKMTVVDSYLEGRRYPDAAPPSEELSTELLDALKMVISVNSSYSTKLDIVSVCVCVCACVCVRVRVCVCVLPFTCLPNEN